MYFHQYTARNAETVLQLRGCWCVDKAAGQSVGAGGTEAHWTSVGVESCSAADYAAESNRKTTQQGLILLF